MDLTSLSDSDLMGMLQAQPMPSAQAAPDISNAIFSQESGNNPNTNSSVNGAIGQAQIMPGTFAQYAKPGEDINNPDDNTAVGQRIIADYNNRYNGDPARVATAYFSGPGNVASPDNPTPWIKNKTDGNGKSVSSYVSDIMGKLGNSIAPDAEASTAPTNISSLSDNDLLKMIQQQGGNNTQNTTGVSSGSVGQDVRDFLAKIGASASGQAVGAGINSAQGAIGNVANMFGANVPDATPTPDLDTLRQKGWSGTTTPEKFGAVEESLFNSPTGKIAGMLSAAPQGAVASLGLNTANQAMEKAGVPHQYSQAAEMAIPGIIKALPEGDIGTNLPGILGDNSGLGINVPEKFGEYLKNQASGTPETIPTPAVSKNNIPPELQSPDISTKEINQAHEDITPFLKNDAIDLNKAANELEAAQKINPNVTALDIMAKDQGGIPQGSNMVGLAKSIAVTPGEGRTSLQQMAGRGYTASNRIGDAFDQSISKSPYYKVQDDAIQTMDGAGPLYEKAYAGNPDVSSPVINRLLKTDAGRQALSYAANRMNTKMSLMGVPDPELAEQAKLAGVYNNGGISKGLKLQTLQYVKEGYDNQISSAFNAGEKGKASDLIEQKNGLLNQLDKIDQQNTGGAYAQARATYASGAKIQEALSQGRSFMAQDPEEIQAFLQDKGRSNPEKVAYTAGVRRSLQDMIDNQSETTNPINRIWKPSLQKRLQPLFPDKQSFDNFSANMQHEKTMARVNSKLQGGSDTVEKAAFNKSPIKTLTGNVLRFGSDPLAATGNFLGEFADKALAKQAGNLSQNSKAVIAKYLSTKDPNLLRYLAKKVKQ